MKYTLFFSKFKKDVAKFVEWFARCTLEPADTGRFVGGHLLYIFSFLFFQLYHNELLPTSNMN